MVRTTSESPRGEGRRVFRVKLVDEVATEPGTHERHVRGQQILREVAESPSELHSPMGIFDKFEMRNVGGHWVVETTKELIDVQSTSRS